MVDDPRNRKLRANGERPTKRRSDRELRIPAVLGRVLRERPYALAFIDTVGGHPLAGGTLRLAVPATTGLTSPGAFWTYLGSGMDAREIAAHLTPVDGSACEVRLTVNGGRSDRVSHGGTLELEAVLTAIGRAVLADAAFAPI